MERCCWRWPKKRLFREWLFLILIHSEWYFLFTHSSATFFMLKITFYASDDHLTRDDLYIQFSGVSQQLRGRHCLVNATYMCPHFLLVRSLFISLNFLLSYLILDLKWDQTFSLSPNSTNRTSGQHWVHAHLFSFWVVAAKIKRKEDHSDLQWWLLNTVRIVLKPTNGILIGSWKEYEEPCKSGVC